MGQFSNRTFLKWCNSQMEHFGVATLCHISRSQEQRNVACVVLVKIPPWWGFDSNDNSWGFVTSGIPPLNIYIHDTMMSHSQIVACSTHPQKDTMSHCDDTDDTSRLVLLSHYKIARS